MKKLVSMYQKYMLRPILYKSVTRVSVVAVLAEPVAELVVALVPVELAEAYVSKRLIFRYVRKIPDYFSVAGAP